MNIICTEHIVVHGLVVLVESLQLLGRGGGHVGEDVVLTGVTAAGVLLGDVVQVKVSVNFVLFHHS